MALGSNSSSPRIFLTVGFGKIRQKSFEGKKVDSNTPNAKVRQTQSGAESWAIEHDFVSGTIENIFYKEDAQYGNSFEVVLVDGAIMYQLSFTEDSRFWYDFMKKLPNVDLSKEVKITAFDFVDRDGKPRKGVSVEQEGKKITSYYQVQTDNKWVNLHNFPSSDGVNFKDKDELKVYFIQVKKFLRNEFNALIAPRFKHDNTPEVHEEDPTPMPPDDLPF